MCSVATASLVLIWSKPKVRANRRASSLMPLTWAEVLSRLGPCSWTSSLNSCRQSSEVDICELGNTFIEIDLGSKPASSESGLWLFALRHNRIPVTCQNFFCPTAVCQLSPILYLGGYFGGNLHPPPLNSIILPTHQGPVFPCCSLKHLHYSADQVVLWIWGSELQLLHCSLRAVCPALLPPRPSQHSTEVLSAFPASSISPGSAIYTAESILADSDDIRSGCITVTVSLISTSSVTI